MKILVLNYEYPPVGGGGGEVSQYLAQHYARLGHTVTVLTSHWDGLPRRESPESRLEIIRTFAFRNSKDRSSVPRMFLYLVSSIVPALRLAKQFKPDVVHAHFAVPVAPLAWLLKELRGIPYIITLHGGDVPATGQAPGAFRFIKPAMPPILRAASSLVTVSNKLAQQAQSSFPRIRFESIPNGVDTRVFAPAEKSQGGVVRLCFAGRFSEQKGISYLISAAEEVKKRVSGNIHLELIGDGPVRRKIEREVRQARLESLVSFAGWIDRERLSQKLAGCDIFVLPSLIEGMPMSCLHAMACGCAIVATRVGGTPEVVQDEVNGLLVPPADTDALATAILRLITDEALRRQYGAASRAIAERDFNWETIARRYLDIIQLALSA